MSFPLAPPLSLPPMQYNVRVVIHIPCHYTRRDGVVVTHFALYTPLHHHQPPHEYHTMRIGLRLVLCSNLPFERRNKSLPLHNGSITINGFTVSYLLPSAEAKVEVVVVVSSYGCCSKGVRNPQQQWRSSEGGIIN